MSNNGDKDMNGKKNKFNEFTVDEGAFTEFDTIVRSNPNNDSLEILARMLFLASFQDYTIKNEGRLFHIIFHSNSNEL